MVHTQGVIHFAALFLLGVVPLALSHEDESLESGTGSMGFNMAHLTSTPSAAALNSSVAEQQSYFTFPGYGGLMLAHIAIMVIAWFFILPIGESVCTLTSSKE